MTPWHSTRLFVSSEPAAGGFSVVSGRFSGDEVARAADRLDPESRRALARYLAESTTAVYLLDQILVQVGALPRLNRGLRELLKESAECVARAKGEV